MANAFDEAEIQTASLYSTHLRALFAYPELIAQGGGFIKRKLLQRRFSFKEKAHFIRQKAYNALNADYHKMVIDAGLAPDFKAEWLPKPVGTSTSQAIDKLWQQAFNKVGWPLLRTAIKTKYKILGKPLRLGVAGSRGRRVEKAEVGFRDGVCRRHAVHFHRGKEDHLPDMRLSRKLKHVARAIDNGADRLDGLFRAESIVRHFGNVVCFGR